MVSQLTSAGFCVIFIFIFILILLSYVGHQCLKEGITSTKVWTSWQTKILPFQALRRNISYLVENSHSTNWGLLHW